MLRDWTGCLLIVVMGAVLAGCGASSEDADTVPTDEANTIGTTLTDPDDPSILRRPFTADQIRDNWLPGQEIDIVRRTPEGETVHRWTLVSADEQYAEIRYEVLDEQGRVSGEPELERTAWSELRDHATFPAATATLEQTTRETALGTLEGWLYTVRDEEADTISTYFFAESLPGAPVYFSVRASEESGGELRMEMEQIARR